VNQHPIVLAVVYSVPIDYIEACCPDNDAVIALIDYGVVSDYVLPER
jgi:hypothetical protein